MVVVKGELNRAAYSAAKGGVIALTRSMAADFVGDKVRVKCLRSVAGGSASAGSEQVNIGHCLLTRRIVLTTLALRGLRLKADGAK